MVINCCSQQAMVATSEQSSQETESIASLLRADVKTRFRKEYIISYLLPHIYSPLSVVTSRNRKPQSLLTRNSGQRVAGMSGMTHPPVNELIHLCSVEDLDNHPPYICRSITGTLHWRRWRTSRSPPGPAPSPPST